jgi:glutamate dehydrogenase
MDTGAQSAVSAAFTFEQLLKEAASAAFPGFALTGPAGGAARFFLRQWHEEATPEDVRGLAPVDLIALAHGLWTAAERLPTGEQVVRIRPALGAGGATLGRDLLEVCGPDMEFLVDSIMREVSTQGHSPIALFHPIVAVGRDEAGVRIGEAGGKESYIQIHLEPMAAARAEALAAGVRLTLTDARAANTDFRAMKARMSACAAELERARTNATTEDAAEAVAFLRWLEADNFIFIGCRDYKFARDADGAFIQDEPIVLDESGLGVLRDPDRFVLRRGSEPSIITPQIERFLSEPAPIVVSKSNLMSRVHRRVYADYIGMKRYDGEGRVIGETRFVGLFTAEAYYKLTRDIPLIRLKMRRVLERAGKDPASHNGKALQYIVETYPRDELFQISEDELLTTALGILHLFDRPRTKYFARRDRFDRYVSVMVFVPKDRFNAEVRARIGEALARAYGGRVSAFYPLFGDAPLARIHYIIGGLVRGQPEPDHVALEVQIGALTRTWEDGFDAAAGEAHTVEALKLDARALGEVGHTYRSAFSAGYRDQFDPYEGLRDAAEFERIPPGATVRVRTYPPANGRADAIGCRIYSNSGLLPLSEVVPIIENLGLSVMTENNFPVRAAGKGEAAIHDFDMRAKDGRAIDVAAVEAVFAEAFEAIWTGKAENDGFNRLILACAMPWREAALIRALARYRTQTGLDPSPAVQMDALAAYSGIARKIVALFRVRFDPSIPEGVEGRKAWADQLWGQIEDGLKEVASLDADRAIRRIAKLTKVILRTNYYQPGADGAPKAYMAFKIASPELEELPLPKPYREIWVAGPEVEGVHLRFGPVARGGLRWSDRRDDFRVEVLDLVKAQQVKNAIIVPVGAKGGFFPKRLPNRSDPNWGKVGQEAYKTFLRALLDITDNIVGADVIAPKSVVRWDQADPYLVVAADKGTATFSDIANGISADFGHWLGDAFASGGSVGYDHKGMGITAKGAWEAVKRHFREIGKDIQAEAFSVIGVGDMSGDVFGNGMLLSPHIKLIAAFDHRDIFFDPEPDAAQAFKERERMFALPRSSWQDYDKTKISSGGGVFSRAEKSIPLSPQMRALCGLKHDVATPSELISALLKAPVELLWFGGIGTFVKAAEESHADVGDKANDAHRINAEDLNAKVIGEGANLGVTQAGRIAFAGKGGRINTDAVDNSAGVDTSDHEVNIKILLGDVLQAGALKADERAPLLAVMTPDVGQLVLRNNYDQTLALTLAEAQAPIDLDSHERFMERLERTGKLSRAVEGLGGAEAMRALRDRKQGLSRPELAKLIAYAKIDLFDAIVASDVPDDPHFAGALCAYFPPQLARFQDIMQRHRLRREIIATGLASDVVNMGGVTFVDRVRETARADAPLIASAFEAARQIYSLSALAGRINALDNRLPAAAQSELHLEIAITLRRIVIYLVRHGLIGAGAGRRGIGETIAAYKPGIDAQRASAWQTMTEQEVGRAQARVARYTSAGAPEDVARDVAVLAPMIAGLDVVDLAERRGWPVTPAASVFRAVGARFGLDRLRGAALGFQLADHWDRLALRRTLEELYEDQRALTEAAIKHVGAAPAALDRASAMAVCEGWLAAIKTQAAPTLATVAEIEGQSGWTFAKTILAAAEIRGLATLVSG